MARPHASTRFDRADTGAVSLSLPDLATDAISLRAWTMHDIDVLVAAGNDQALRTQLGLPAPYTATDAHDYVAQCSAGWASGDQHTFAVTDRRAGTILGSVRVGRTPHGATAGYWTAPWARRRGVASNALRLVSVWAIEHGLSPIRLYIDPDNIASQGVARRAGYRPDDRNTILDAEGRPGDFVFITSALWNP